MDQSLEQRKEGTMKSYQAHLVGGGRLSYYDWIRVIHPNVEFPESAKTVVLPPVVMMWIESGYEDRPFLTWINYARDHPDEAEALKQMQSISLAVDKIIEHASKTKRTEETKTKKTYTHQVEHHHHHPRSEHAHVHSPDVPPGDVPESSLGPQSKDKQKRRAVIGTLRVPTRRELEDDDDAHAMALESIYRLCVMMRGHEWQPSKEKISEIEASSEDIDRITHARSIAPFFPRTHDESVVTEPLVVAKAFAKDSTMQQREDLLRLCRRTDFARIAHSTSVSPFMLTHYSHHPDSWSADHIRKAMAGFERHVIHKRVSDRADAEEFIHIMTKVTESLPQKNTKPRAGYQMIMRTMDPMIKNTIDQSMTHTGIAAALSMCRPPSELEELVGQVKHHSHALSRRNRHVPVSTEERVWQEHGMSYREFNKNAASYMEYSQHSKPDYRIMPAVMKMAVFHAVLPEICSDLRVQSKVEYGPMIEYNLHRMHMNLNGVFAGASRECNDQENVRVGLGVFLCRFNVSEKPAGKAAVWRFCVSEQFKLGSLFGVMIGSTSKV